MWKRTWRRRKWPMRALTSSVSLGRLDELINRCLLFSVLRLLQYCRNEWLWHLSGFTWLFIYSLSDIPPSIRFIFTLSARIFIPYYTGQVIASVVSSTGDKYAALISSVKLMLFISVVSSVFSQFFSILFIFRAVAGGFRGGSFEYAYARINRGELPMKGAQFSIY